MPTSATETEQALHILCRKSFLSYWTFPNPFRRIGGIAKELCDALVICGPYILAFSDKSIAFPNGDQAVAWERWKKRSVLASAKQLLGAHRYLMEPMPELFSDSSTTKRLRCNLPSPAEREVHLIAVANGATEVCSQMLGEPIGTLMLSNDPTESECFVVGDVGNATTYVHVFTDLSLRMVLHEFDTVIDLVNYLRNRTKFFRSGIKLRVHGEEEIIPLYFRGYSEETKDYDIARGLLGTSSSPDFLAVQSGFYDDLIKRPEYLARRKQNKKSYLWDKLIEQFAKHQIAGTATSTRPSHLTSHEGGIRYMALESRLARRSHGEQLESAIVNFPDSGQLAARTLLPGPISGGDTAYIFLQVMPPHRLDYEQYRMFRSHFLGLYTMSLMHDHPALARVIGIACEPPRLFQGRKTSEDIVLIERDLFEARDFADAKKEKVRLTRPRQVSSGTWTDHEFPTDD